jgi:SOS response regulatory protein OraA/RecX
VAGTGSNDANPIDLAAKALRHGDRSRHEIDKRLARAGIDDEARAESLATLERLGYVDDSRFATGRAAALAGRGYGDAYIAADLEQRGADPDSIAAAIAELVPERLRARELAERLGATVKTAAQLARKGFTDESLEGIIASDSNVP